MLKDKISVVPEKPGSYQFLDANGKVIYIGKAKNLKKRLASYFTGAHDAKTSHLVMNIVDFEYIVTSSELDALLLELNLIKKFNPRYNIMLTDDKTYPYIEITNETHPKIIVTRRVTKNSKNIFGPYPNVGAARATVQLLNKLYPLRKCKRLPKEECLYYHMGQCLAPCIKDINEEDYQPIIVNIRKFLKGDISSILKELNVKMDAASESLEYEKANEYKLLISDIKTTVNKQKINLNDQLDRDIIGYFYTENYISIEIFFIRSGKISARHQKLFEYYSDPYKSIEDYIAQFYEKKIVPKEIFMQIEFDTTSLEQFLQTTIVKPKIGDKKKLLDLAILNAEESLIQKTELYKREQDKTIGAIEELGKILKINPPYRIEAFDNSNLFGTDAVSSMIVFTNGKKDLKEYRKYKIKTMDNKVSDYDTMKEVLYRRYLKVIMEDLNHPDLIVVDGGKPQISAANEILATLNISIPLVGLVKDDTHSTSRLMDKDFNIYDIKKRSNVFHLLTRIQDEAHRFAINFHKSVRSKSTFNSVLDDVSGIG
ncbi:MAG: excinuclease ABC subunit UvrC, partial [Candidatus Izemoplasma sp.]